MIGIWLSGLLRVRSGRLIATALVVMVAVALLATLGGFLSTTRATMTSQSVRSVSVDWQVQVTTGADAHTVLSTVRNLPGTRAALPVGYAQTGGLTAHTGGTAQNTGAGSVLGLPPGYAATFPGEIRLLAGREQGVLLAQQTAANLHAAPGDTVTIQQAGGLPPVPVRVSGVVDLPYADSLFQKVGAPPQSQPSAPPDNVVLMPRQSWNTVFGPLAPSRPDLAQSQIHTLRTHSLPSDPAAAYSTVSGNAHHAEVQFAGTGLVGDNLGSVLDAARSDALYAQLLFLFLGVPGAALAAALTWAVAQSGAGRRRKEQALLRTRGATVARLMGLAAVEAAVVAVAGAAGGLGLAMLVDRAAFHGTGIRRPLTEPAAEFEPVDVREPEIDEEEIGGEPLDVRQGARTVGAPPAVVAQHPQGRDQPTADRRIVLDDQNARHAVTLPRPGAAGPSAHTAPPRPHPDDVSRRLNRT